MCESDPMRLETEGCKCMRRFGPSERRNWRSKVHDIVIVAEIVPMKKSKL
jgi:hypothetical protein